MFSAWGTDDNNYLVGAGLRPRCAMTTSSITGTIMRMRPADDELYEGVYDWWDTSIEDRPARRELDLGVFRFWGTNDHGILGNGGYEGRSAWL